MGANAVVFFLDTRIENPPCRWFDSAPATSIHAPPAPDSGSGALLHLGLFFYKKGDLMVRTLLRWTAFAALLLAGAWVYKETKLESWLAAASALVVFLGSFLPVAVGKPSQHQVVGNRSTGIQVGGDLHVGKAPHGKRK